MALIGIAAIAVVGAVLGKVLGTPKTFVLVMALMIIWFVAGWFLGGWRAVMAGLAALTAALTASDGTYPLAFIFSVVAFLFQFAHLSSSNPYAHTTGLK